MNLIEFIGFVVGLVALLILSIKKARDDRYRRLHPEEYEEEKHRKEEALKEFLRSVHIDVDEEEEHEHAPHQPSKHVEAPRPLASLPIPKTQEAKVPFHEKKHKFEFESSLEHYRKETGIEKRKLKTAIEGRYQDSQGENLLSDEFRYPTHDKAYTINRITRESRAGKMIEALPSPQQMLVFQEIFSKPKALRNPRDDLP